MKWMQKLRKVITMDQREALWKKVNKTYSKTQFNFYSLEIF